MLCFGQIETTLSKSFSVEKNTSLDLVGNINTSYFLLLRGQRMDQLVKFNRELVMEDVYSFNQPENEHTILNFVKVKDSIFSLAYRENDYLFGPLVFDSTFENKTQHLFHFKEGIKKWRKNIRWKKTNDQENMVFYIDNRDQNKDFLMYIASWNRNSKKVIKDTLQTPLINGDTRIKQVEVDNNGNIYVLVQVRNPDRSTREPGRYSYAIVKRNILEGQTNIIQYVEDSLFLGPVYMKLNNHSGQLVLAGLYSKQSYLESHGTFITSYDVASLKQLKHAKNNLSIYQRRKLGAENVSDNKKGIEDVFIKDMLLRSDGGVILLTETQYSSVVNYSNASIQMMPYTTNEVVYYHYNDAHALSLNPDATVHWSKLGYKQQETDVSGNKFASYASGVSDRGCYFMYNKNINKSFALQLIHVDPFGDVEKKQIVNDRLLISSFEQIGRNHWMGIVEDYGDYRLLKVKL